MLVSNSAKVRELVPNAGNTTITTSINPNITFPSNRTTSDTRTVVAKQQQHQQREHDEPCEDMLVDEEHQPQASTPQTSPQKPTSILQTATKFTLIDSNGEIIGNAAATGPNALARQQMLLANGIRIVTPVTAAAAAVGLQQNKTISIPLNGKNVPIITGLPYQLAHPTAQQSQQHTLNNSGGVGAGGGGRNKQFTPLTPPPMSSRKFVEPSQYRIRSFSLSSHKISANHQMHVQNSNGNSSSNSSSTPSNNSMMVDDIPPTQQHTVGYATSSAAAISNSQQHSPPRQGNHYMHMINAATSQQAGSAGGNPHVSHVTPRRRTISSTSNG